MADIKIFLFAASHDNGYFLRKKRRFKESDTCRFPVYKHQTTKSNKDAAQTTAYAREYVFEKTRDGAKLSAYIPRDVENFQVETPVMSEIGIDTDSSDYAEES